MNEDELRNIEYLHNPDNRKPEMLDKFQQLIIASYITKPNVNG